MAHSRAGDLIRQCTIRRSPVFWEDFVARFARRLERSVRRTLRRRGAPPQPVEVEDLVQDVYCRLLERDAESWLRTAGDRDRELGAYLSRVAETVVIDHLRARRALKRGRGRLTPAADPDLPERARDPSQGPEERLLARERRRVFLETCRGVVGPHTPRRDFQVLKLAFLEGWSSREISRRLGPGMTPNGVDSLVHRVRKRLERLGVRVPRRVPGGRR